MKQAGVRLYAQWNDFLPFEKRAKIIPFNA